MAQMDFKPYMDLITSQHRNSPKYMAWVQFLLSLFNVNIGREMMTLFNVNTSVGQQLDVIGELVGVNRAFEKFSDLPEFDTVLPDESYRRVIMAKIVRNQFKGQQGTIRNLWDVIFGNDILAVFADNQDMTMDVDLIGDYTTIDLLLLFNGYIVPKPLGVGMKVNMTTDFDTKDLLTGSAQSSHADIKLIVGYQDPLPDKLDLHQASVFGSNYGGIDFGVNAIHFNPEPIVSISRCVYGTNESDITFLMLGNDILLSGNPVPQVAFMSESMTEVTILSA